MEKDFIAKYRLDGLDEPREFHSHHEYEIYFFHEGSCKYIISNQIYDLQPNDILLMNGLALHKPNAHPNQKYIRSVVLFSPKWITELLKSLEMMHVLDVFQDRTHFLIRTENRRETKRLEEIICSMAKVKKDNELEEFYRERELKLLVAHALLIVHRLAQRDLMEHLRLRDAKAEYVGEITNYIQDNYMHKLTLDTIANEININKFYMVHLFKEITGLTVMEYVMGYRLTQIKHMLETDPNIPLNRIAYQCGFESPAHFSRYFREKLGLTPSEYRKSRLKDHNYKNTERL